jgi:hypothetical protein
VGVGLDARLTTLLCKKLFLRNPRKLIRLIYFKTNVAQFAKEGCGSNRAVQPMMMMMMMMMIRRNILF